MQTPDNRPVIPPANTAAQYEIERLERAAGNVEASLADFVLHMGRLTPDELYGPRAVEAIVRVIMAAELTGEVLDKMDP